ncbi:phage portal protein [Gluconacetobacter entanii]|uniref:Portal protein n=1 Tax=Gluconacetobacter entanii TaxID=108528 RepID=A0A318PSL1_9PROT|nr:portal protein [Gluconacetobacter entanii]PYD63551.1 portal protein [Gluconacetobacter entanii]
MDWKQLKDTYPKDQDLPVRANRLTALMRVRDCTQYDDIENPFSSEYNGAGEYIPLDQRRPSVRTNLCATVVDESASLVFGEMHWPSLIADEQSVGEVMAALDRECALPAVMIEAVIAGSVGSSALLVEVVDRVPCVSMHDTRYLTPEWDATNALVRVTECYKVKGADLSAQGWKIPADDAQTVFWWRREWGTQECRVYVPTRVADGLPERVDTRRTTQHGLGFVPWVWMANMAQPGTVDGPCTFERAIDTVIECDYLLSQSGRGLKYSADPKLVIKASAGDPAGADGDGGTTGGSASALTLPLDGDAKLLEINGDASGAMLNQYRELRAIVLEQIHGNRAHADKISAAQSGRAMEMMCQSLVWLADRLRLSYGEYGLLALYRMICRFSHALKGGIRIGGQDHVALDDAGLALQWPPYFPSTDPELLQLAQGLATAVASGFMSNETACSIYAAKVGTASPQDEWNRVLDELSDPVLIAKRQAAASAAKTDRKAAGSGSTETRQVTA